MFFNTKRITNWKYDSFHILHCYIRCYFEFSAMTNHDYWLGYLVAVFMEETIVQSKECCPGCHSKKNSVLLHSHHQSGLLEKLYLFHPVVKETMLSKMTHLVADYVLKFPDPEQYDEVGQRVLKSIGKDFLNQSNPTFLYYSHYVTPEVDAVMNNKPIMHVKPMNLKRVASKMSKPPKKKCLKPMQ